MGVVKGRVLVGARGQGELLCLRYPISFWGGVDPEAGTIVDPRHPDHGRSIAGKVLFLPEAVGSSSSSAIMLELLRHRRAPAAILMAEADAILALGVVVAAELGYDIVPVVEVPMGSLDQWNDGTMVRVDTDGTVQPATTGKGDS